MLSSDHIISRLAMVNRSVLANFSPPVYSADSVPHSPLTSVPPIQQREWVMVSFPPTPHSQMFVAPNPHSKADLCSLSLPLCLAVSPTTNPNSRQNSHEIPCHVKRKQLKGEQYTERWLWSFWIKTLCAHTVRNNVSLFICSPTLFISRLISPYQISLQSNSCISKTRSNNTKMRFEEKQLFYGVTFFILFNMIYQGSSTGGLCFGYAPSHVL